MKNLLLSTVVSLSLASPVIAQDSFNVQQAMEEVRQENLQRIGVERKQQIVSTLRKQAEDLAAINEAGFTVTPDGGLKPKQNASGSISQVDLGELQSGLFTDMDGSSLSAVGDMATRVSEEQIFIALKAILSERAVLNVNGFEKRYKEGDEILGGFTLMAINARSVDVKSGEGDIETYYMDWAPASNRMSGAPGSEDSMNAPGTFTQSSQPVEGLGAGF